MTVEVKILFFAKAKELAATSEDTMQLNADQRFTTKLLRALVLDSYPVKRTYARWLVSFDTLNKVSGSDV